MRRLPVALALVALVALVVLARVSGSSATTRQAPASGSAPVTSAELTCSFVDGAPGATTSHVAVADIATALTPPSRSAGTVSATLLAATKSTTSSLHAAPVATIASTAGVGHTYSIAASGPVAATLAADVVSETTSGRFRSLAGGRCETPATDWWFTGAEGRVGFTDVLQLANPTATPAQLSLTFWGQTGPQPNSRYDALQVPARSTLNVPIASAAPNIASVGIHVHVNSGAVTAMLRDRRTHALTAEGGDFIPATSPPSRTAVLAGFPAGRGPRYLILTNPGARDATVDLQLVTSSGRFRPAGATQVVVRSGHSRAVDLSGPMAGATGAVVVASDQPVVANAIAVTPSPGKRPDLTWLAAAPPLHGSAGVATGREPDGGHTVLLLTAPAGAARVRVSAAGGRSRVLTVPAGRSTATDVTATVRGSGPSPFAVTALSPAPVYGTRVLSFAGAHGALITSEPLIGLPAPIALPPVREGPRAALR